MRFAIPIHICNRPRFLVHCLESLKKNSFYKHDVILIADRTDKNPKLTLTFPNEACKADALYAETTDTGLYTVEYLEKWRDYNDEHLHVSIINWTSPYAPTNWMDAWGGALNYGIKNSDNEWILTGVQDDNYFAPNWDLNIAKYIPENLTDKLRWFAPITVFAFPITGTPHILKDNEEDKKFCAYREYPVLRERTTGNIVHRVDRSTLSLRNMVIYETDFCTWLIRTGVVKPKRVIAEPGGHRLRAGECPTLMHRSLWNEVGGYTPGSIVKKLGAPTFELDDRMKKFMKVAPQDSVVLNTFHDIIFDKSIRGGVGGLFDFGAAPCHIFFRKPIT